MSSAWHMDTRFGRHVVRADSALEAIEYLCAELRRKNDLQSPFYLWVYVIETEAEDGSRHPVQLTYRYCGSRVWAFSMVGCWEGDQRHLAVEGDL